MKKIKTIITVFAASVLLFSCGNNAGNGSGSKIGKTDSTASKNENSNDLQGIKIGTQTWSAKNLDVSTFRNGDAIPEAKTEADWMEAGKQGKPAWCYYNNDPKNGKIYGKLYNWYAVNDARGLAPKGWHVPTDAEWTILTDYIKEEIKTSTILSHFEYDDFTTKMMANSGWDKKSNGTNESGFSALPGGRRDIYGNFIGIGDEVIWWCSTEYNTSNAWCRYIGKFPFAQRNQWDKLSGFSVRCVKD